MHEDKKKAQRKQFEQHGATNRMALNPRALNDQLAAKFQQDPSFIPKFVSSDWQRIQKSDNEVCSSRSPLCVFSFSF